jgi:RNA polymerase sigma-70 factor (ECF subfamily)
VSQVATLLLGIARLKALSRYRRHPKVPQDRDAQHLIEDASGRAAALLEKRRRRGVLEKCMTTFPPVHRHVINLIPNQGKEVDDVAQTTEVPVSTIKTRSRFAGGHMARLFAAARIERPWTALYFNAAKRVSRAPDQTGTE